MALFERCVLHLRESAELEAVHAIQDRSTVSWREVPKGRRDVFIEDMVTEIALERMQCGEALSFPECDLERVTAVFERMVRREGL